MRTHIVAADLKKMHERSQKIFVDVFDEKMEITQENMLTALAKGLPVFCFDRLISHTVRAEYERATNAAVAEYKEVTAPARVRFKAAVMRNSEALIAEYQRELEAPMNEYHKKATSALVAALTS